MKEMVTGAMGNVKMFPQPESSITGSILRCLFFRFRFYSCSYVFKTEFIVAMKFVVCQMPLKP